MQVKRRRDRTAGCHRALGLTCVLDEEGGLSPRPYRRDVLLANEESEGLLRRGTARQEQRADAGQRRDSLLCGPSSVVTPPSRGAEPRQLADRE